MRPKPKVRKRRGKAPGLCPFSNKTMYLTEGEARKGMTLIWGSDPNVNLGDLHVYNNCQCGYFHVGHISAYQKKCPICMGKMYKVKDAEFVCAKHERYLLTTCSICGRLCFSTTIRLCHSCGSSAHYKVYQRNSTWVSTV